MGETIKKELVQRIVRNLLDVQLLRIVQVKPTWGYDIKKQVELSLSIKLRHGDLYPTLNALEQNGFLRCQNTQEKGRVRKVYSITPKGDDYLQTYYSILRQQIEGKQA
jgi:PadR family transcriptional regulator, regulatory protein PadR